MSVTIKTSQAKFKDESGAFVEINALAEKSLQETLQDIEDKGHEVKDSIPSDYSQLSSKVEIMGQEMNTLESDIANTVKTVNGNTPDSNGNVTLSASSFEVYDKTAVDNLINNEANLRSSSDNQLRASINEEASARQSQDSTLNTAIGVERNRINNLINSVTTDSEVIDIRTGADGHVYSTAGDAVRTQVTNLKEDLTEYGKITNAMKIDLIPDKYIDLSGTYVNLTPATSTSGFYCAVIECNENDLFFVNGTGGSQARLWAFADASRKIITVSEVNTTGEVLHLIAPANTKYAIFNVNANGNVYLGRTVKNTEETIYSDVANITKNEVIRFTNNCYINVSENTVNINLLNSQTFSVAVIDVNEGDVFTITGTGGSQARLWAFADSSNNIIKRSSENLVADDLEVKAPSNASKLIVQLKMSDGGYCLKGSSINNSIKRIDDDVLMLTAQTIPIEYMDVVGYETYYCPLKSGRNYIFEILEGSIRAYTRKEKDGSNIQTLISTDTSAPAFVDFVPNADTKYIRISSDSAKCSFRIYEKESLYAKMLNSASNENYDFSIADFTPNTYYTIPDVGNNITSLLPTSSSSGNNTKLIKIKKGTQIVFNGSSADYHSSLGLIDSNMVVTDKFANCLTSVSVVAKSDGYALVTSTSNNFGKLSLISNPVNNGYYSDIYAPYPQLPANSSDISDLDSESVTSQDIYNYIDNFVNKYPQLITKEVLGNDATGAYPVNRYVVCDSTRSSYLATIFIGANEHGPVSDPRECSIVVCRLIKDLCEAHSKDNKFLNILKKYFKFVIIPVQNPYGFDNTTRNNGNNVDIDRNYATSGWSVVEANDKGSSAGSEIETQYIMNSLSEYDVDIALDLHCLGNTVSANDNKCHYASAGEVKTKWKLNEIIASMKRDYNFECTSYGTGDYTRSSSGNAYFNQQGIVGMLLEFQSRDGVTGSPEAQLHTSRIMEANYTFMLRILNMLISDFDGTLDVNEFV